jgi:hypothetical protein
MVVEMLLLSFSVAVPIHNFLFVISVFMKEDLSPSLVLSELLGI